MARTRNFDFPDGAAYVGEWRDGIMNGQGTLLWQTAQLRKASGKTVN